jgi:hypothetical protein
MLTGALLVATSTVAGAEEPVVLTGVHTVDDMAALGTDTALSALSGCSPVVENWDPEFRSEPVIENGSTYYAEVGGGWADLSCAATVTAVTRILNDVVPLTPVPYRSYYATSVDTMSGTRVGGTATIEVPYFGPDAVGLRPFGHITVQVQLYQELSTDRYAVIPNACMEWQYVVQPGFAVNVHDPRHQGACASDAMFASASALDSIQQRRPEGGL